MTSYEQVEPEPYIPHDYERSCECKSCSRERGEAVPFVGRSLGTHECTYCGAERDPGLSGEFCPRCEREVDGA